MPQAAIEAKVAVNTETIALLRTEVERCRERLHMIEATKAAVSHLVDDVKELHEEMPNLARRSAREAVDEYLMRQRANTLSTWRSIAALVSAGAALGSLIVYLLLR